MFSRWNVQLFELPFFGTDNVSVGSHVSYTIIDWLMHNDARDKITLRFISFSFKRYLLYILLFMSFILPFFIVYVVRILVFLSFMSFVLPFFAVRCRSYCLFYHF